MPEFESRYRVSFGDCDPAGIVFYPNIFAWLDRTVHEFLRVTAGGHAAICATLNARGLGLVSADCSFRRPVSEGDELIVEISQIEWSERALQLSFLGRVGETAVFEGHETRALFVEADGRLRAGDTGPLRALLVDREPG